MTTDNKNNIKNNVLNEIKSGEIKMKPRSYFMIRTLLFALGISVLFLFVIYIVSFIVFSLRISGIAFLPLFGFRGIRILFGSLPWLLLLLAVVLIIGLEVFAEHISFIYKRPIVYSLVVIIAIVLIAGFLLGISSFHSNLFYGAQEGHLPFIGSFYRGFGAPQFENIHHGIVSSLTNSGFVIETPNGEMFTVLSSSNGIKNVKDGDSVLVIGERKGNVIQASDVKKITEDLNFFPSHRRMMKERLFNR